jgi:hypothetical protein
MRQLIYIEMSIVCRDNRMENTLPCQVYVEYGGITVVKLYRMKERLHSSGLSDPSIEDTP